MNILSFGKTSQARILFFLTADVVFIILSVFLAFLLRFEGIIPPVYLENDILQNTIILSLLFTLPSFYFLGLYSFTWVFVSINELISLTKAITLSFIFSSLSIFLLRTFTGFPRSTLIITYFLIFLFCGGIRFLKRIYLELFRKTELDKVRILIVGGGSAGVQILRSIKESGHYWPVGFVDDDPAKQGIKINGLKVLGRIKDIPSVISQYQVQEMIIALPSAGAQTTKQAVESGRKSGLKKIRVLPLLSEIIGGQVSIRDLREIQVEDLLGREVVSLDTEAIEKFIKNKTILITGAAGSIGSELSRQAAQFRPTLLLLLDQDETGIFNISKELDNRYPHLKIESLIADIRDQEKIDQIFAEFKPNIVFHAAAYKHVFLMEEHPDMAVKNNIFGTEIVAEASLKFGVEKFIFISTDKAVNPNSVMGTTKRIGEMICQTFNQKNVTKFMSVRFGNVLDSRGSVIPIFKEQIRKGGPVEVTHPEMKRYFMMIPEAVLLVMQAAEMGKGGEVFVLDMGKPIKIIDLAKEMIRLSGFEPDKDIPIVFTEPKPGEKLFEEILTTKEETTATQHQKIFIAKLFKADEDKTKTNLEKLKAVVAGGNKEEIKSILKDSLT